MKFFRWRFIFLSIFLLSVFLYTRNIAYSDWTFDAVAPAINVTITCSNGSLAECAGNATIKNMKFEDLEENGVASGLDKASYSCSSACNKVGGGICADTSKETGGLNGTLSYTSSNTDPPGCEVVNDSKPHNVNASATDIAGNSSSLMAGTGSTGGDGPPTITFLGAWYKLKDASFHKYGSLSSSIPSAVNILAYDADDNATQRYLVSGTAGVVSLGTGTTALNGATTSVNDWQKASYSQRSNFSRASFLGNVKSKKTYVEISNSASVDMTDIDDAVTKDGIYIWTGDLNFSSVPTSFGTHNAVLLISGTVTISVANFNPTKSIAILANKIVFNDNVTEADGIFIGDSIQLLSDSSTGSSTPLKIVGNLISWADSTPPGRERNAVTDNNFKPSLFVVFKPKKYIDLLPYLSTATYDWKQLQ